MIKLLPVTILLSATSAFSGTMGGECEHSGVTSACDPSGWFAGAHALYLQPLYNNNFVIGQPDLQIYNAEQPWAWGYDIIGGYKFKKSYDATVEWSSLTTSQETKLNGAAIGYIKPSWNAVNMQLGNRFMISRNASMRLHAGAQYTRLVTGVRGDYFYGNNYANNYTTTFNGFGPRLGIDACYKLYRGLKIYGKYAGSVLSGTAGNDIPGNNLGYGPAHAIVPEMDAKLGLMYKYRMNNSDLVTDIGWMWVNYFNIAQVNPNYMDGYQRDFGLQGLYFGMKLFMN